MTTWILGPCTIANRERYLNTADHLVEIMGDRDWYYKASFDKANRTSLYGGRGVGLEEGIELFREVKEKHPTIKLTTDIHEVWQGEKLAGGIDLVQIPAFLCRQTDLIVASAQSFDKVNIKKGQWIGPNNLIKSLDKIKDTDPSTEAWVCDRGSNYGYDKLIVDFTIIEELKKCYDKVVIDCTHSTQRSRHVYGTQGDRSLAEKYLLSSGVFGYDAVFAEVHPHPPSSTSDADCQIDLSRVDYLITKQEEIKACVH